MQKIFNLFFFAKQNTNDTDTFQTYKHRPRDGHTHIHKHICDPLSRELYL